MSDLSSGANFQDELSRWLRERGYVDEQLDAILKRVELYDEETVRNAFFDSVGSGSVDLNEIIADALGGREVDDPS